MIRLALIGAGNHSWGNHAPALSQYATDHPERLELAAVCDLDSNRAKACAEQFGFKAVYTDYRQMLAQEKLDGCVCVMPVSLTAALAVDLLQRGVPTTIEKPMGATLAEVAHLLQVAEATGTPHMVSVNRRFEPLIRQGIDWAREQGPLRVVRASILRHNRFQPDFMSETAIHCIDTLREIAGEVADVRSQTHPGEPNWFHLDFEFESGVLGTLDVLPSTGSVEEKYELFGDGFRVEARVGPSPEPQLRCWREGEIAVDERPPANQPNFIRVGPYAETHEFVTALQEGRSPWPSVADVFPSVEIGFRFDPSKNVV